ncbi:MAG TPA: glycine--tRNA ligase subunit beta, partial [Anaerolineales bacterium]
RFVEDNWESPALGAWGLGWEVWLDGLEITQYTYFQQAGGQALDPVSVELTYGIDRIVMALQGARHFADVRWSESVGYGELLLEAEREHTTYYFEAADVERMRRVYEEYESEARLALERGLVLPAYDYLLKCSHTFNILDTRGAIGVTERAAYFGRMRALARGIAEAHVARREKMGFPLGVVPRAEPTSIMASVGTPLERPADFVLEIGCEELPHREAAQARETLRVAAPRLLLQHGLVAAGVEVLGTPRRLALVVKGLEPRQRNVRVLEKGPPADRAFDAKGDPTQAALGWARKQGIAGDAEYLRSLVRDEAGGRYLVVEKERGGETASNVLRQAVLPALAGELRFERAMRWLPHSPTTFSRPVRWLLAMHGDRVVPFAFAGGVAGAGTRGLRAEAGTDIRVAAASEYTAELDRYGIVLDPEGRKERILEQAERLAAEVGGKPVADEELLNEVVDLVEAPAVLLGRMDEEFLTLPRPVLVAVMKKYQRYFAVEKEQELLPYFLAVANGRPKDLGPIRQGNENVLRARFADAAYFVRRDLEVPLEAYRPRLQGLVFHSKRGTMLDKCERLVPLVVWVGERLALGAEEAAVAARAAYLCKADLTTRMVVEITALHGEMGREYALRSGEPSQVAQAIYEHVLPRAPGDSLPQSRPGTALALADRLDTLAALFSIGVEPTGTRDPFGLRRTALGLIQVLTEKNVRFAVDDGLRQVLSILGVTGGEADEVIARALEFLRTRLHTLLLSGGRRHDVVEAVLARQAADPAGAARAVKELEEWREHTDWPETLQAFARSQRIQVEEGQDSSVKTELFLEEAEGELYRALLAAQRRAPFEGSPAKLLGAFRLMVPAITRFFEDVLVMDDREELRRNRLALLRGIHRLADGVADLSRLEGY